VARLRPARPGEQPALTELCLRSKAYWGYDAAFMAACRAELTLGEDLDRVIVAEDEGQMLGLAELSPDGGELEKLFVAPEAMGRGLGRQLLDWCAREAAGRGVASLVIESDPGAADFYRRMGAVDDGVVPSGSIPGRVLPRLRLDLA
jgi:GNAT superfamily N-acetyltransferase